jgi:hypothetical protein
MHRYPNDPLYNRANIRGSMIRRFILLDHGLAERLRSEGILGWSISKRRAPHGLRPVPVHLPEKVEVR